MQTFLIVVGILFACGILAVIALAAWVKKVAAKGAVYVMRQGLELVNEQGKAHYVTAAVRARLDALNTRVNAIPDVSIWNAKGILLSVKPIVTEMAEIAQEIERLKEEDQRAKEGAITVDATDVTPGAQLALPAPSTTPGGKSNDEILADFKAEWVTPDNRGVVDAWIVGAGDDTFIQYQLSLDVADTAAETGKLPEVPHMYQGIATLITWFPRD